MLLPVNPTVVLYYFLVKGSHSFLKSREEKETVEEESSGKGPPGVLQKGRNVLT